VDNAPNLGPPTLKPLRRGFLLFGNTRAAFDGNDLNKEDIPTIYYFKQFLQGAELIFPYVYLSISNRLIFVGNEQ
jgi:hypothetical protein